MSIIKSAGIPWLAEDRSRDNPLVAAEGVSVFLNPEPVAPFFDLMFIGEAEKNMERSLKIFDPCADRRENLERMARRVPGVYVASFYNVEF